MGRCQGRYCGPLVVEAAARATGLPVTEDAYFAPRAPLKPVPIGAIAQWPPTEGPPA
jgi:hypothetical protein